MEDQEQAELRVLLHDLKHMIEAHIEQENEFRPKIIELVTILERSKGVIVFLKLVLYVGAPILAVVAWAKDHVKM